jgi:hypothetical protein
MVFVFFFPLEMRVLSVDPAFRRCGLVVINDGFLVEHHENIDFVGPENAKLD